MPTRYIARTGKSTNRVTKGKDYEFTNEYIIDDNGDMMKPCLDFGNIWFIKPYDYVPTEPPEEEEEEEEIDEKPTALTKPNQTKKGVQMIQIEEQVLINGKPSGEYSIHELLALLADAEEYLVKQEKLSRANGNMLADIVATQTIRVAKLVNIIKEREEEF